jgi:hypothetical protein
MWALTIAVPTTPPLSRTTDLDSLRVTCPGDRPDGGDELRRGVGVVESAAKATQALVGDRVAKGEGQVAVHFGDLLAVHGSGSVSGADETGGYVGMWGQRPEQTAPPTGQPGDCPRLLSCPSHSQERSTFGCAKGGMSIL